MENSCQTNNTITIDADTVRFFVGPPSDSTKECIYKEAVRRAYSDMSRRTLHFDVDFHGDKTGAVDKRKNDLEKLFRDAENSVLTNPDQYDSKHKDLCQKVSEIFTSGDKDGVPFKATDEDCGDKQIRKLTFSMGQAQKVVNMVWKYVYLFYQYFRANEGAFDKELKEFQIIIPHLHAPVDSLVINAAGIIGVHAPKWPWSQLNYAEYEQFQTSLREALRREGKCPFLWELQGWPFK